MCHEKTQDYRFVVSLTHHQHLSGIWGERIARTIERIAGEIAAAVTPEHVTVTKARNVAGIEKRLQELSDTINERVHAQKEENQIF